MFVNFQQRENSIEDVSNVTSGFNCDQFPRLNIIQISNGLENRDTCINRFQSYIYQINLYTKSFSERKRILNSIKDKLRFKTIPNPNNCLIESFLFNQQFMEEIEQGIFFGSLQYELGVQKQISSDYELGITTAEDLF